MNLGDLRVYPAEIGGAFERATGRRLTELPMSPPKVLAAIEAGGQK